MLLLKCINNKQLVDTYFFTDKVNVKMFFFFFNDLSLNQNKIIMELTETIKLCYKFMTFFYSYFHMF